MNHSMINASVSMNGLQQKLDILANNIANINTVGYKRKDASFQEILTSVKNQPEKFQLPGRMTPSGLQLGWGARLSQISSDFTQGPVENTQNSLDLMVQGDGMFEILVDGKPYWTKSGSFQLSVMPGNQGLALTTKDGHYVSGLNGEPIILPPNTQPKIDEQGNVVAYSETGARPVQVGRIRVVQIERPQLLEAVGENLYTLKAGIEKGQALRDAAGLTVQEQGKLKVMQGYLEQSNVNLPDEMTELINVQRAFQLSSRAVTSSDSMMGLANNLRG